MSMSIYASTIATEDGRQVINPVIGFECWDQQKLADDADAREERGEDPFILNPDYIPHAGMSLANHNARTLFSELGFEIDDEGFGEFPIGDVHAAALKGLNGNLANLTTADRSEFGAQGAHIYHCGIAPGQMRSYLERLMAVAALGRKLGATQITVA